MSKCQPPWVAPLFNLDRDMSTRVLTNPSNKFGCRIYRTKNWRVENERTFSSIYFHITKILNRYLAKRNPCYSRINMATSMENKQIKINTQKGPVMQKLLIFLLVIFLILQKYPLDNLNHIHICQVSQLLRCSNTCQIWMWYRIGRISTEIWKHRKLTEIDLVTDTIG